MLNIIIFTDGSLELEDELFVQVKPGLSSFADNPKKVNFNNLKPILKFYT